MGAGWLQSGQSGEFVSRRVTNFTPSCVQASAHLIFYIIHNLFNRCSNYQLSYFCFHWIQVLCPSVGESWDWRGCLIDLICLFATYLSAQASIQRDKSMDMGRDLFSPPNLGDFLLTHSFARICDQNWTQQLKLLLIWKRCTKMLKHGYLWFSR